MADTAKTREFDSSFPAKEETSGKAGWLATLAVLSLLGLVIWFVLNSSHED